ncbi:hypothetical protein FOZ63_014841, partial [Perkinsus olseni]
VIEAEVDEEDPNGQIQRKWLEDEFTITSSALSRLFVTDLLRTFTVRQSRWSKPSSVSDIVDSTVNDVDQHGGWDLVIWSKASQCQGVNDTGMKPPKNHLVRSSLSNLPDNVRAQRMNRR